MNEKQKNKLEQDYKNACNAYLKAFGLNYELFSNEDSPSSESLTNMWVLEEPGTIAEICGYFVKMEEIILCVDKNVPFNEFERWYQYNLDLSCIDISVPKINLRSWLGGCPRKTQKQIDGMIKAAEKKNIAYSEFQKALDDFEKD